MASTHYAALRLRESSGFVPDEAFVQRLWFEGLFKNPLDTTDGRRVRLLQPGFWNRGSGPDFQHAAAELPDRGVQTGPVEIHLTPGAFRSHGHDSDPLYGDLLLHAVWMRGLSDAAPSGRGGIAVPVIELCGQMRAPLAEAKACFAASPAELEVGARLGRCQRVLAGLPDEEIQRLVSEAGWFRFHQRIERWRLRRGDGPLDEALWQGLAEVLGYAKNREAMTHVARLVPVESLEGLADEAREALLFGAGGWMQQPAPSGLSPHVRKMWDVWWQRRAEFPPAADGMWKTNGIRPSNRPERRIAALAWIAHSKRFAQLKQAVEKADDATAKKLLLSASHPEWDFRFSLRGVHASRRHRLIGADRVDAFLFNVFWPLAYAYDPERVKAALQTAKTAADSLAARRTRVRLLSGLPRGPLGSSLLASEGLLQIYRDFCLEDRSGCGQCEFPEWVALWRHG